MSIVPFSHFSDRLPYRTILSKYSGNISFLSDLYKAIGNKTAYKRYSKCWDYFPNRLSDENLSEIISILRQLLNSNKDKFSLTIKSADCQMFYEDIGKQQLKKMLHCAYALKHDLYMVNKQASDNEEIKR